MIKPPVNFNGVKFAEFYNLAAGGTSADFWVDGNGYFHCPSLPDLTEEDLAQFICGEPGPTVEDRMLAAETLINLILDEEGE